MIQQPEQVNAVELKVTITFDHPVPATHALKVAEDTRDAIQNHYDSLFGVFDYYRINRQFGFPVSTITGAVVTTADGTTFPATFDTEEERP